MRLDTVNVRAPRRMVVVLLSSSLLAGGVPAQTPPASPPSDTARPASDPVEGATHDYREHGIARTIVEGSFETFPYGHSQPTLTAPYSAPA